MKKVLFVFVLFIFSCQKEAEKPKCYTCTTKTTTYMAKPGYPKEKTGLPFESCTDISGEKRNNGTNNSTVQTTKCIQDK